MTPETLRAVPISLASDGMTSRRVSVLAADVVFVKGILEASEGLASLFADEGGELTLAAPLGREADLDELISDLRRDISLREESGGVVGVTANRSRRSEEE